MYWYYNINHRDKNYVVKVNAIQYSSKPRWSIIYIAISGDFNSSLEL